MQQVRHTVSTGNRCLKADEVGAIADKKNLCFTLMSHISTILLKNLVGRVQSMVI